MILPESKAAREIESQITCHRSGISCLRKSGQEQKPQLDVLPRTPSPSSRILANRSEVMTYHHKIDFGSEGEGATVLSSDACHIWDGRWSPAGQSSALP
jgi:hypothetical protein